MNNLLKDEPNFKNGMKKIITVSILILFMIIGIYFASVSIINLQDINKEVQESKPLFEENVKLAIENCELMAETKNQDFCVSNLKSIVESCNFYGNPEIYKDSRIKKYLGT